MARSPKVGQCVYCGRTAALTKDHIPPQNLFANSRHELIKVPSCQSCNGERSADDEYFKIWLVARGGAARHADADALLPSIHRSFAKPEASGLLKGIWRNNRVVEQFTPAGLYMGRAPLGEFRMDRIETVARRITQGIFFRERHRRLRDDYCARAFALPQLNDEDTEVRGIMEQRITALQQAEPRAVGSVFRYWWVEHFTDPDHCEWLFEFFGRLEFFCVTGPPIEGCISGAAVA